MRGAECVRRMWLQAAGSSRAVVFLVCLVTAVTVLFPMKAQAAGQDSGSAAERVFDDAELFTESEREQLEEEIAAVRSRIHIDVVIVTASDTEGYNGQEYADSFYDEGGFGEGTDADGILFLIDMDHRELTCSTTGSMVRIMTDERIGDMLDRCVVYAGEGDYAGAAEEFLESVETYCEEGVQSGQYTYDPETGRVSVYRSIRWYEAAIAFAVAAGAAGSACLGVRAQYGMKKNGGEAAGFYHAYTADCHFSCRNQEDELVHQFVTHRIIPTAATPRNGGRGGGGRSSSGRSTVHRSSSGRSHGGGSRKF